MATRFWYSVFVILNFVVLIYLFILFLSSLFIFKRSFWCSFAIVQICLFKLLFDYSLLIFYHFKVSILKFSTGTSTEFIKITSPSKSKKFKFTMSFGFLDLILTAKCSVFRSWSEQSEKHLSSSKKLWFFPIFWFDLGLWHLDFCAFFRQLPLLMHHSRYKLWISGGFIPNPTRYFCSLFKILSSSMLISTRKRYAL